jgi:Asp-tRNA(Asn)/Glu-tRNA(Gln) amidotransferase C subunit
LLLDGLIGALIQRFLLTQRIDKEKDRKDKIKNHHSDIINIFEHLGNITVDPVDQKDSLYRNVSIYI